MAEIIFVCRSKNNKNVRDNELKILRKNKKLGLCFEFGENEMKLKKRFYDDENIFEEDFKKLQEIKAKIEKEGQLKENKIIDRNIDKKETKKNLIDE